MQLSIGFSPCPNDTFMVDALLHRHLQDTTISWTPHIADVETLNEWALNGTLDVTKLSFATWLRVQKDYALLHAGAALGFGCGPLLIARRPLAEEQIEQGPVAIPGVLTTANLLFTLRYPNARKTIPMLFSDIEDAVLQGEVIAGVIIHENRFTYAQKGLYQITDLGAFWEAETGAPIPLGAFAIRRALGSEAFSAVNAALRASVGFALESPGEVMPFVRKHAQEMDESVLQAHIRTYVNAFSLDLGAEGFNAVDILQTRATGLF